MLACWTCGLIKKEFELLVLLLLLEVEVVVGVVVVDWFLSPVKRLSRISWGTLHPHPLRSEYLVKRQLASSPFSSGLNGKRKLSTWSWI